ncbi:hypothetical protein [Rhizobium sp. SG741]|uniref:hypothetical protein n=1 Tax=Rhizobium sp. SG741 TaxID=2587114 RepID=UPI0006485965|nr:hypothetical protein [Rhizobium sp. SG741]NKJ07316.1 hypothetical protein [Rhizobium sp. SG741]
MLRFALPILFAFAGISPALCDDAGQAPPPDKAAEMQSMKDFLQANSDCREFTDSCSYCVVTDGRADCSTPQIACVKKEYQCTARSGK